MHSGGSDDGEVAFDAAPDAEPDRLRPHTRQAIQVAVATALAILAGNLLSETRWYWAYITALVVFLGTESRGRSSPEAGRGCSAPGWA